MPGLIPYNILFDQHWIYCPTSMDAKDRWLPRILHYYVNSASPSCVFHKDAVGCHLGVELLMGEWYWSTTPFAESDSSAI